MVLDRIIEVKLDQNPDPGPGWKFVEIEWKKELRY